MHKESKEPQSPTAGCSFARKGNGSPAFPFRSKILYNSLLMLEKKKKVGWNYKSWSKLKKMNISDKFIQTLSSINKCHPWIKRMSRSNKTNVEVEKSKCQNKKLMIKWILIRKTRQIIEWWAAILDKSQIYLGGRGWFAKWPPVTVPATVSSKVVLCVVT